MNHNPFHIPYLADAQSEAGGKWERALETETDFPRPNRRAATWNPTRDGSVWQFVRGVSVAFVNPSTTSGAVYFKRGEELGTLGEPEDNYVCTYRGDHGFYLRLQPVNFPAKPFKVAALYDAIRLKGSTRLTQRLIKPSGSRPYIERRDATRATLAATRARPKAQGLGPSTSVRRRAWKRWVADKRDRLYSTAP